MSEDEFIYQDEWFDGFASSNVEAIRYSFEDRRLYVRFHSGGGSYFNVDEATARDFYRAGSKGKFVWRHLRDIYHWSRD